MSDSFDEDDIVPQNDGLVHKQGAPSSGDEHDVFTEDDPEAADQPAPQPYEAEPVPEEVLEQALALVKDHVSGNGLMPEDVARLRFKGEVLRFSAIQHYTVERKTAEKDIKGQAKGKVMASRDEVMREIERYIQTLTLDKSLIKAAIDVLNKRPDTGFAIDNEILRLDKYKQSYAIHTPCGQCGGKATANCASCQGRREVVCVQCKGERTNRCPTCSGSQYVNGPQGQQQCFRCHGQGHIHCNLCRATGRIPCRICRGTGSQDCSACAATGYMSHLIYLQLVARSRFEYDRKGLPQKAVEKIDLLGPDLVTQGYAKVKIQEDVEDLSKESKEDESDKFHINYTAKLPYGTIDFSLKSKTLSATLFGYKPGLIGLPNFIEGLTKKGSNLLLRAASTPSGSVHDVQPALRYRLIREVLYYSATGSKAKAESRLEKTYRFGIRIKTIKKLLQAADLVLDNLTRKARLVGLVSGSAAALALYSGVAFSGLGKTVQKALPTDAAIFGFDMLIMVSGVLMCLTAFKFSSGKVLKTLFGDTLEPDQKKKLKPKITPGVYGVFSGLVIAYIGIMMAGTLGTDHAPAWVLSIGNIIGL